MEMPKPIALAFLAKRPDGLTFAQCVKETVGCHQMIVEYDRLRGTNLSRQGSNLDLMIDDACKRTEGEIPGFLEFVWDCVFLRCPPLAMQGG